MLAMITSANNPPRPMDVPIDVASAGLRSASKVRMKLFTLDNRLILHRVGTLSHTDQRAVTAIIARLLAVRAVSEKHRGSAA